MSEIYPFVLYMACGGDDFHKKFQILEKKIFFFILFYFLEFLKCYYCSINLKRQSEHSGLRPDTSSLVAISTEWLAEHFFDEVT